MNIIPLRSFPARLLTFALTALLVLILLATEIEARKVHLKLKAPSKPKVERAAGTGSPAERSVSAESDSLLFDGLKKGVIFSGFDKKGSAQKESFFISNSTQYDIAALEVVLTYETPDGRMLDSRNRKINIAIPAGETRKADIPTFDIQKSFHYFKSNPSRQGSAPFKVKIQLLNLEINSPQEP